jgi:hypothetical protein
MTITLTNEQKQFLFKEDYVNNKTLDSLTYEGWQNYFINGFEWVLRTNLNKWGFNTLKLFIDNNEWYSIELNFQGDDLKKLLNI